MPLPSEPLSTTVPCAFHPSRDASRQCRTCYAPMCVVCEETHGKRAQCVNCSPRVRIGRRVVTALVGIAAAAVVAGVALRPDLIPRSMRHPFGDAEAKHLQGRVAAEPCDGARTLAFVEHLMNEGENRQAIEAAERFLTKCGDAPRLRWTTHEAHRRLFEWDAAAQEATRLIDDNRYDPDYWWWRGQDHRQAGRLDAAESDFRMATALCPDCTSAVDLADVLEKQGRPCEGISPLAALNSTAFQDKNEQLLARIAQLRGDNACRSYLGDGTAKVLLGKDGHARIKARINGQDAGIFLVDTGATAVVVSKSMAGKLGINGPFRRIVVKTANGFATGGLTIVDNVEIASLRARNVEVVVLDRSDVDALLGMSFLSRFTVALQGNELSIQSPSATPAAH